MPELIALPGAHLARCHLTVEQRRQIFEQDIKPNLELA